QRTITGVTNMLANHRQHEPIGLIRVTITRLITEGRHPWLRLIAFHNGDDLAVVVDMVLDDQQRIRTLKLLLGTQGGKIGMIDDLAHNNGTGLGSPARTVNCNAIRQDVPSPPYNQPQTHQALQANSYPSHANSPVAHRRTEERRVEKER